MRYLCLVLLLGACDAANDAADPNAPPSIVSGVAVDTFIVMRHPNGGLHLVDPTTGKAGPSQPLAYGFAISSIDDDVAISPDHQRIAWVKSLGTIAIARPELVAGLPTLVILRELPDVTTQGVAWSPDGDRLVTTLAVIDPDSGETHFCPDDDPSQTLGVLNETLPIFPGTHRYVCPDGENLYDDGVFIGHAGLAMGRGLYDSPIMTADGQLYGTDFHQPSGTTRPITYVPDPLWQNWALPHFRLADGKTLVAPESVDDGYVYDLAAIFRDGTWQRSAADRWFIGDALQPFLRGGDAAIPLPLAVVDGGRALVYRVRTMIEAPCPPEYIDKCTPELTDSDSAVVEVTPAGAARGGTPTSTMVSDAGFIRLTDEAFDLAGDDFLVAGWTPQGQRR